uniref:Uncharacterized protein n=1 Tax=Strigamia maritima TaxID=126957 RepID=T1J7W6_STRMM
MDSEDDYKSHRQVQVVGARNTCLCVFCEWIYHKTHICMCIEDPKKILRSQWPISPIKWLNYRIVMAAINTVLLVLNFASVAIVNLPQRRDDKIKNITNIDKTNVENITNIGNLANTGKYFIYFPNWGLILLAISFNCKAYVAFKYFRFLTPDAKLTRLPVSFIISWIFNNLNNPTAFGITLGYWVLVYDGKLIKSISNFVSCVMNSVFTLVDIFMSETPVHFCHFYQPFIVSWSYIIFTHVYYISGGRNENGEKWIYSKFKWETIHA